MPDAPSRNLLESWFLLRIPMAFAAALTLFASASAAETQGVDDPIHGYYTRPPKDRFTRFLEDLEAGRRTLDTSGELPLLTSLLRELETPVSSQLLVYSVTSLQKALISPKRPRALFFNEDTYVGYVPGGRIEVISLDPDLGGIFFISKPLVRGVRPQFQRSDECMTCHAPHHMQEIPGLVIESVVPGITGGGERAFRRQKSGHSIPLEERFGGWHVTGAAPDFPHHWGNLLIERAPGVVRERPIAPGELFDFSRYPVQTSDILPHLLQEHQVGFVNRALQAAYRTRALLHAHPDDAESCAPEIDELAHGLVRYLLFADEVALPACGVAGDPEYRTAFQANARRVNGVSLKDLDGRTRLMRYRCSYMIYSPAFAGLPKELKERVFARLGRALKGEDPEFAWLSEDERTTIANILRNTLSGDAPPGWLEVAALH